MLIILLPSGLAFLLSVSLKRSLGRMNKHRGLLETHQRCFNEAKTKRYRTDAVLTTVLDCSLCVHEYQLWEWEETRLQRSSFCDHAMICLVTSKLPLHVDQLVHHQSLSDSEPGQRCVVLAPLQVQILMSQTAQKITAGIKTKESSPQNQRHILFL